MSKAFSLVLEAPKILVLAPSLVLHSAGVLKHSHTIKPAGSTLLSRKNARNPNHHYLSKEHRNTRPICIAIRLQFVLQYPSNLYCSTFGAPMLWKCCQYSSHLYRSTPPIYIAICLPFVSQYFWDNLCGCGRRDVQHFRLCWQGGTSINVDFEM